MSKTTGGISLLLALLVSLFSFDDSAHAAVEGDYVYTIVGSGVSITDYTGSSTNLVIPKRLGGLPVVEIADHAFFRKNLTHVTLPSTLRVIGTESFELNHLTTLDIPDGLEVIGAGSFSYNQLVSINIPQSVTHISTEAFTSNQLTSIVLPTSVVRVYLNAFKDNDVSSLRVESKSTTFGTAPFLENSIAPANVTVYGYSGSPAQTLANTYGYKFVPLFELTEGFNTVTDKSYAVSYHESGLFSTDGVLPYEYARLSSQ